MLARRRRVVGPALLCGLVVAAVLLATPVGFLETLVASSGLSEVLPAAAPPLGLKARLLLAAFGGLMAAGVTWAGPDQHRPAKRKQQDRRRRGVAGVKIMGFALSKLGWLSRSRGAGTSRGSRPALRRADAHPDAPARTPIFASRDFGGLDIFPRVTPARLGEANAAEPEQPPVVRALPRMAASPECDEAIDAEFEEVIEPTVAPPADPAPEAPVPPPAPLSIAELTERLERGLARRVREPRAASPVLADMPVEAPVPVRDHVDDQADQALRAALSTLRAMADRTR